MNAERIARDIITIGASAGGVEALLRLLSRLPGGFPASIAAVIHRSPLYVSSLAEIATRRAQIPVEDAGDGATVERGRAYLAPPDFHLVIEKGRFRLQRTPKMHFTRPAVDPLFYSAASTYGPRVVGVILSGGGDDGVSGLIAIKAMGGLSVVQAPTEAGDPWMPANAITYDHVDAVLPVDGIAEALVVLASGGVVDDAQPGSTQEMGSASSIIAGLHSKRMGS